MAKPFLSVIIVSQMPEDTQLPLALIDIDKHLSNQEYTYEIILVNGRSFEKFGELIKNLKIIEGGDKSRIGSLAYEGVLESRGNWKLLLDYKSNVPVSEFNKLIHYFSQGFEVFIGKTGYGFLCFSEEAAKRLFPLTKANGWAFTYELLKLAKFFKYKTKKISLARYNYKFNFNIANFLPFLWEIVKVHWRLWTKFYQKT